MDELSFFIATEVTEDDGTNHAGRGSWFAPERPVSKRSSLFAMCQAGLDVGNTHRLLHDVTHLFGGHVRTVDS